MRNLLLVLLFVFSSTLYCSEKADTAIAEPSSDSMEVMSLDVKFLDNIKVENVSDLPVESSIEKNMPWIIALIIGILSVIVNFWVAHRLRQSNERNLKEQIKSNERNLKLQTESNERSNQNQINANKESKLIEFQAIISTKNRQEWINDLRQTLSEYLSTSTLMTKLSDTKGDALIERNQHLQKMVYSKSKLELLMTPARPEQKKLLNNIENLLNVIVDQPDDYTTKIRTARSEIIDAARALFDIHWTKIKELK